jgi:hypothetical protein
MNIEEYLEFKALVSDSHRNAKIRTGANSFMILPVYTSLTANGEQRVVEMDSQFYIANTVPGFIKFETKPEFRKVQITGDSYAN